MRKRRIGRIMLIVFLVLLLLSLIAGGIFYYIKYADLNKQKVKLQNQLKELPELESDVFSKCMEGKGGTAENIAFCQENTQKHIHDLAQDLSNAKKDLDNKKWYQVIQ
jgi:hypothetical protein